MSDELGRFGAGPVIKALLIVGLSASDALLSGLEGGRATPLRAWARSSLDDAMATEDARSILADRLGALPEPERLLLDGLLEDKAMLDSDPSALLWLTVLLSPAVRKEILVAATQEGTGAPSYGRVVPLDAWDLTTFRTLGVDEEDAPDIAAALIGQVHDLRAARSAWQAALPDLGDRPEEVDLLGRRLAGLAGIPISCPLSRLLRVRGTSSRL